jgi:hypothetical protein
MSQNFSTVYMMRVTGVSQKPDVGFPQVLEVANKPRNENRIQSLYVLLDGIKHK